MADKYFVTVQVGRYAPGDELNETDAVGNVLVLLGKARKESVEEVVVAPAPVAPTRRRGRPPRVRQGDGNIGVATAKDFKGSAE